MGKLGLVLEGGGMRGIYTAGVLDVFMENDLTFDGVIGVSAGAIHGSSLVSKQPGRNLRYYKKYSADKRFMSARNFLRTGDVFDRQFCYEDIPKKLDPFDYETYANSTTKLYVTCTNVETGKAEYLQVADMDKEVDLVRASASLPYLSKNVRYGGKQYLDGGCADSIPLLAFERMGYDRNVVVLTREDGYVKQPENVRMAKLFYRKYPEFVSAMAHRHEVYNETLREIHRQEDAGRIFVIRPSHKLPIERMSKDPQEIQNVYDVGVEDAKHQLQKLKAFLHDKTC